MSFLLFHHRCVSSSQTFLSKKQSSGNGMEWNWNDVLILFLSSSLFLSPFFLSSYFFFASFDKTNVLIFQVLVSNRQKIIETLNTITAPSYAQIVVVFPSNRLPDIFYIWVFFLAAALLLFGTRPMFVRWQKAGSEYRVKILSTYSSHWNGRF